MSLNKGKIRGTIVDAQKLRRLWNEEAPRIGNYYKKLASERKMSTRRSNSSDSFKVNENIDFYNLGNSETVGIFCLVLMNFREDMNSALDERGNTSFRGYLNVQGPGFEKMVQKLYVLVNPDDIESGNEEHKQYLLTCMLLLKYISDRHLYAFELIREEVPIYRFFTSPNREQSELLKCLNNSRFRIQHLYESVQEFLATSYPEKTIMGISGRTVLFELYGDTCSFCERNLPIKDDKVQILSNCTHLYCQRCYILWSKS